MTVADYRQLKKQEQQTEPTFDITAPSGMIFTVQNPDFDFFLNAGILPPSLVVKVEKAKKENLDVENTENFLTEYEQIKFIEYKAKLVRSVCVNPRIVDNPKGEYEIAPEELTYKDFFFLLDWAQKGGEQSDGLGNFQRERMAVSRPSDESIGDSSERETKGKKRTSRSAN